MLTRGDFAKVTEAVLAEVAMAADPAAYSIRVTSGTMSGAPVLVVRRRTVAGVVPPYDYYAGARAIVKFHGPVSARLLKFCEFLDYGALGRRMLVVGMEDLTDTFESLLRSFRPDCFSGIPSFIIRALEYVRDPAIRAGIKVFGVYGDSLNAGAERFFRTEFPHARILDTYGSAETPAAGNNLCGFLPRGLFHPSPWVTVEVIDPDETGAGDIALSVQQSRTVRLERYLIGDRARIIPGPCRCGAAVTFEMLGRKEGNAVKLAGALLFREEFDRVSRSLGDYILDYRARAREYIERGRPRAEVTLEIVPTPLLSARPDAEAFLARAFAERLWVTPTQTLAELIRQGIFAPLTATLVMPFPPYAKEVKLIKVSHGDRSAEPLL